MTKLHISEGNSKLGRIPNLNLTPGPSPQGSCRRDAPCFKPGLCYSRKAWLQYPLVREQWSSNLSLWRQDPAGFKRQLVEYLELRAPARFRFHSSGDIPDQKYADMIISIAADYPQTQFLVFTKQYELRLGHDVPNLSIVYSRWPGLEFPAELRDQPQAHFEDGVVSTVDTDDTDITPCSGSCKHCSLCWLLGQGGGNLGHVLFHKH